MKNLSQREIILKELLSGDSITPQDAYKRHGIMRLSDIVFKLRNQGFNIEDKKGKPEYSDYYIDKDKNYIIQNIRTGLYLKRLMLNPNYLDWTNDKKEAAKIRVGFLFKMVQLLETEEKLKIRVCEQK